MGMTGPTPGHWLLATWMWLDGILHVESPKAKQAHEPGPAVVVTTGHPGRLTNVVSALTMPGRLTIPCIP